MTDAETIRTVAWAIVFVVALQGLTTYAIVRVLTTGVGLFERRSESHSSRRILHGVD